MLQTVLVFLGGGIGAATRHGINLTVSRLLGTAFPWSTFIINISGSTLMGLIAGFFAFRAGAGWSQDLRLFLTTGILGGYTTFSAYSLDAALLFESGRSFAALAYIVLSVVLAILGLFAGLWLIRAVS